MKMFIFTLFILFSALLRAEDCPKKMTFTLENKKIRTYCMLDTLKVSESCYVKKENCELVKKVKENKKLISKALSYSSSQNPGSWACGKLGFKVLMAKTASGSDVCTCENELGESVVCISLTY